jgi:hypothetical protein
MRGPPQDRRNKLHDLDDAQRNTITLNNLHLQSPCLHLSPKPHRATFFFCFEGPIFFSPGIALAESVSFNLFFNFFPHPQCVLVSSFGFDISSLFLW